MWKYNTKSDAIYNVSETKLSIFKKIQEFWRVTIFKVGKFTVCPTVVLFVGKVCY